jgi:hypothetical protein
LLPADYNLQVRVLNNRSTAAFWVLTVGDLRAALDDATAHPGRFCLVQAVVPVTNYPTCCLPSPPSSAAPPDRCRIRALGREAGVSLQARMRDPEGSGLCVEPGPAGR